LKKKKKKKKKKKIGRRRRRGEATVYPSTGVERKDEQAMKALRHVVCKMRTRTKELPKLATFVS